MIVFLLKHLKMAGCEFPSSAMQCHPCDPSRAGGFSPAHGILLCQNRVSSKKHMEDTLAHELIHAYDHCKFKVDWMNLRHHACTEVSARFCCCAQRVCPYSFGYSTLPPSIPLASGGVAHS